MADEVRSSPDKLEVGRRVTGTVYRIHPNRILLNLPGRVHGIIRQREFSWEDTAADPDQLVQVGKKVDAIVLASDPRSRHVELSLRSAERDPWADLASRYPEDQPVEGTVVEVRQFGAFVQLEPGVDGLVPVSEIRLGKKPDEAQEVLWVGDRVQALVKDVDPASRKISLSIRAFVEAQLEPRRQTERESPSRASLARFLDPATARKLRQRMGDLPPEIEWPKPEKIRTVLIADDDDVFRVALAEELEDAGYDVTQAVDHPSALDAVRRREFDLAILDLSLSEPSALSLGEEIAKLRPAPRILLLSGFEIEETTLLGARELGFSVDHKPFGARALAEHLRSLEAGGGGPEVEVERSRLMRQEVWRSGDLHFDAEGILQSVLDRTCAGGIALFRQHPDLPDQIEVRHSLNVDLQDDKDVLGTLRYSPVGDVMAKRRTVLIDDVRENPARSTYLQRAVDFRSCLGVPVSVPFSEQPYALFLFSDRARCLHGREAEVEREAEKLGILLLQQSVNERFLSNQGELLRSQLRAGALHDLRNALGSLDFRLDRLNRKAAALGDKPSRSEVEALRLSITETQAIAEQMKKTTDLFRELGTSDEIEPVEVNAVVRRIVERHQPLASHWNVKLQLHSDKDMPSTYMNLAHLQQVIDNLILNALQWSADRRDRRVRVETRCDDEAEDLPIEIRVLDTGPGIHRQLQDERIFELGYSRRKDGSGLGLFVARVLTQASGGELRVESSVMEVGTRMLLRLPKVGRDQVVVRPGETSDENPAG